MSVRLFVDVDLKNDVKIDLIDNQHHYLTHVMRRKTGDNVSLFNGRDGEWNAVIAEISKKKTQLTVLENTRLQTEENLSDVWLCFAPIKKDNMEFVVQKATELGISVLQPVITRRTVVGKVNVDKMRLQAIEAAEQCERLSIPLIKDAITLDNLLKNIDSGRRLYFLDERGDGQKLSVENKVAYLVGPEGGFDADELKKMRSLRTTHVIMWMNIIIPHL